MDGRPCNLVVAFQFCQGHTLLIRSRLCLVFSTPDDENKNKLHLQVQEADHIKYSFLIFLFKRGQKYAHSRYWSNDTAFFIELS
jgi:hypothetical protein